nr:MAG TPA: hypothetical protein [Caudoviricetes sp.]
MQNLTILQALMQRKQTSQLLFAIVVPLKHMPICRRMELQSVMFTTLLPQMLQTISKRVIM